MTTSGGNNLAEDIVVVAMAGGPGSGKGTQCQLLSQNHHGKIGPKETSVAMLHDRITAAAKHGSRVFILDGFPRKLEQVEYFERVVAPISRLIVLDCPEQVMVKRLTASDRGRFDDTGDIIKRRIETFREQTGEVIEDFRNRDRILVVDADQAIDEVRSQIEAGLEGLGFLKARRLGPDSS